MSRHVGLYARTSTASQDPELQLVDLRRLAEVRGWSVVDEYVDAGISGAQAQRPALDRLLADAQAGRLDAVLVWKLDRLGRSMAHLVQVLQQLDDQGVALVSANDIGIDMTTPMGRMVMLLVAAFAEFERELIRERVIAGVRRAQQQGKHCGRPRAPVDARDAASALRAHGSIAAAARALGVSRATLRRRLKEHRHLSSRLGDQVTTND